MLGDGNQQKSYVYIQDCIEAIITGVSRATNRVSVLNVGLPEVISVKQSLAAITGEEERASGKT